MGVEHYWMDRAGTKYGPFSVQSDGFPNAGEVVRYYREKSGMSRAEFALRLGDKGRWIRKMENQNAVSEMISRRRVIAQILGIPPVLLGVATLGEDTLLKRVAPEVIPARTVQVGASDIKLLERSCNTCWSTYLAKGPKLALPEVNHQIQYLELLLNHGNAGEQQEKLLALLCRFDQLRCDIGRQTQLWTPSTDRMVEIALELADPELAAITLSRRSLWFTRRQDHESALRDAQYALTFVERARNPVQGEVYSCASIVLMQTAQDGQDVKRARELIERAHVGLSYHPADDPYYTRFGEGMFWLKQAEALVIGSQLDPSLLPETLRVLDEAAKVTPRSFGMRWGSIDYLYAQTSLLSGEPLVAASTALDTLERSRKLGFTRNITRLSRLYEELAQSHQSLSEVKELGYQLKQAKRKPV